MLVMLLHHCVQLVLVSLHRDSKKYGITQSEEETSSSTSDSSEEDWECKKCRKIDGDVGDYIGCANCDRWFHERCTTFTNENQYFECHLCKFEKSSMTQYHHKTNT